MSRLDLISWKDKQISASVIAIVILGGTMLWLFTLYQGLRTGKGFLSSLPLIYGLGFFILPLANTFLGTILLWLQWRGPRAQRWLFFLALLGVAIPWSWFVWYRLTYMIAGH
ncbi:MAG: hypothetical protein HY300_02345 [Verrucomicrobia bacterium]|nr:hypothetical protein [Verrucomicrobiota bacterium]